eukprot:808617-Alexandrium_andersonii.AAC.1
MRHGSACRARVKGKKLSPEVVEGGEELLLRVRAACKVPHACVQECPQHALRPAVDRSQVEGVEQVHRQRAGAKAKQWVPEWAAVQAQ